MNLLEEFNTEFIKRHDFYSEDLDLLCSKWPRTKFKDIPEAWIIPIDEMLLELSMLNIFPISIQQRFGLFFVRYPELILDEDLVVDYNKIPEDKLYLNIQLDANNKIKAIDEDLYLFMDIEFYFIELEYNKKYCNKIYYN